MKKYLLILVVITMFSCKENTSEIKTAPSQSTTEVEVTGTDLNHTSSKVDVVFKDQTFTAVYHAYLHLKGSLVNTDAIKAQETAKILQTKVRANDTIGNLVKTLEIISNSSDVKAQRVAFEKVTAAIETLVDQNVIISGAIYKQYCPMAFNGKGAYWLSDSNEVRNPYFGDQMLRCGVVEEEIK